MRKERWSHYRELKGYSQGDKAICGKKYHGWERTVFVHDPNSATCPHCITEMKKTMYYCPTHGFISGKDVTFEETCATCGANV